MAFIAEYGAQPIYNLANKLPTAGLVGNATNGALFTGLIWGAGSVVLLDSLLGPTLIPSKIFGMQLPGFVTRISTMLGVGVEIVGTALVAGGIGAAGAAAGMDYGGLLPIAAGLGVAAVGKTAMTAAQA